VTALETPGAVVRVGRRVVAAGARAVEAVGLSRWATLGAGEGPRRRTLARVLARALERLCKAHAFESDVQGIVPRGPCVLVANHVSWLDPLVIGAAVPCVMIAKAEVADWPAVGPWCRDLGVLFVERGAAASGAAVLRHAWRALRHGVSVLNFPEGTTTRGAVPLPFRRGVFGLARLAGVPVVPVALTYESDALAWTGADPFVPHYFRTAARPRSRATVRFGAPLSSAVRRHEVEALAAAARRRCIALLQGETP